MWKSRTSILVPFLAFIAVSSTVPSGHKDSSQYLTGGWRDRQRLWQVHGSLTKSVLLNPIFAEERRE